MTSLGFGDEGSPPRARGAHPPGEDHCGVYRITPACAGSTCERGRARSHPSDHPRLRGEHFASASFGSSTTGSPPPARGAQIVGAVGPVARRITPACAGSTGIRRPCGCLTGDHPRLRGEHLTVKYLGMSPCGSPPPARGALAASRSRSLSRGDHPRLRGEHYSDLDNVRTALGSPPPARGALREKRKDTLTRGITPACAGSTLLNQGCYVKERRISFTPSRSTGSHGPPVMRKSSPCSLRAA